MAALLREKDPYPHFHAAECYFSIKETTEATKALGEALLRLENQHPLQEKITLLKDQWKV